jgi:integrase
MDGHEHQESANTTSRRAAETLLARRQAECELGVFVAPAARRTTFEDLARIIRDDYAVNGRRSARRLGQCLARLGTVFAGVRAVAITADRLTGYVRERTEQGAARSTIRNELNALRRAFRLAHRAQLVAVVPAFPVLRLDNVRTGFLEPEDLAALLEALPTPVRPVVEFAALTGWRIPSEVLPLTWAQVDLGAGIVRLEPGTTKTDAGRVFPFATFPALAALLRARRVDTSADERRLGQVIRHVFHRQGVAIAASGFTKTWNRARDRAASRTLEDGRALIVRPQLVDRIPHDLRRTAVRNLERAGVSRSVAMQLTGHKTESVYRRYAIVAEADLREGVAKLAGALHPQGTAGGQQAGAR